MKKVQTIILALLLASCANSKKSGNILPLSKNNTLYVIDIDTIKKEKFIDFSSYFKDVKTTILETNEDCLIGNVRSVRVVDDLIIVTDDKEPGSVFAFDKNGRFLRKFGKEGQGPSEYVDITDSSIDFDKKEIYLFDFYSHKINKYDIASGNFINSTNISKDNGNSYFIQYINTKVYTSVIPTSKIGDSFLLQEMDNETGKRINTYLKTSEYNKGGNISFHRREGFFYPDCKGNSKFVQMFMDTIVCLDKDGVKPFLAVNAKNWITAEDVQEYIGAEEKNDVKLSYAILFERDISYNIHRYFETANMIHFQYNNAGKRESVIYDKTNNTARIADIFRDDIVYNDRMIFPQFAFADSTGVYSYLETEDISRFLDVVDLGKVNPTIDKYDSLKKLPEDSNPVIFYYECK